jgi:outer membrane translocation and assembly module TamA
LGLAKANLANANLERIAAEAEEKLRTQQQEAARKEKELMARLHAMEAMMASASSNMDGHASNSSPAKLAAVSAAITKAHHQTGTAQIRPVGITSTIERVVDKRVAAISKSESLGTDTLQENVGPRGC